MRRLLLATALITGSVTVFAATPAYAAPAQPVLSDVDTSVAGHVTGTVTGDADAQSAWVCWDHCQINTGLTGAGWIPLDPATHAATFDLPTWGFSSGVVTTVACATAPAPGGTCSSGDLSAQASTDPNSPLTATDVVPSVTWPGDTTIGYNPDGTAQQVSATVSDTGGGKLSVDWTYTEPEAGDHDLLTPVAHNGTTQLSLADGVGRFRIFRCSDYSDYHCTYYDALDSAETTVDRVSETIYFSAPAITSVVNPSRASLPTGHQGTFEASWHVSADGQQVSGSDGSTSGTIAGDGSAALDIPGSGLPDGADLRIDGTITIDDPDFGPTSRPFTGSLLVDREGPAIDSLTVSRTSIHPTAIDALAAYRTTTIKAHSTQLEHTEKFAVFNASGVQVRLLEPTIDSWNDEHAVWNGRDESGHVVPAGTYTVASVDPLGNKSALSRTVTVSHANGVLKTFKKTVTVGGSKVDSLVGRCSTLKNPASRGWSGSRGYYANSRCKSTRGNDSVVITVHAAQLPSAVKYGTFRVDTYGGASRGYRGSQATVMYSRASDDTPVAIRTLGSTLGTHTGATVSESPLLYPGRTVLWSVGTANFNHYDIKNFTVVARYYAWS